MANVGSLAIARAARWIGRHSPPSGATAGAPQREGAGEVEGGAVRFSQLQEAVVEFLEEASRYLQREVEAGAEVPLELERRTAGLGGPPLYCYRPLTALRGLTGRPRAIGSLKAFPGMDRYVEPRKLPEGESGQRGIAERVLR